MVCAPVQARSAACRGGLATEAYDYIAANGACSEESYPYTGSNSGNCQACTTSSSIAGFETMSAYNDNALLVAISRQPVSVRIDSYG
jgi:hypothetical protein